MLRVVWTVQFRSRKNHLAPVDVLEISITQFENFFFYFTDKFFTAGEETEKIDMVIHTMYTAL